MRSRPAALAAALAIAAGAAAVAGAAPARAATIVFDTSETEMVTVGSGSAFDLVMAPGSTLTLQTDANGDGVEGDMTVAASHFVLLGTFGRGFGGGLGTFTVNATAEITGGAGTGVYSGGSLAAIQWSEAASFSIGGTIACSGADCPFTPDTVLPFETLYASTGSTALPLVDLGFWNVTEGYFSFFPLICAEPPCPIPNDERLEVARYLPLPDGEWFQTLYLRGKPVPEPFAGLLAVGVLAAIALRHSASL